MPNETVRAAATGLPKTDCTAPTAVVPAAPESCRAFQLGAELGRLTDEIRAVQEAVPNPEDSNREVRLLHRINALSEAVTYARATSLPGALAQVVVAFDRITDVAGGGVPNHEEVELILKGAQRALFSIADVLAAQGGVPATQLGSSRFMNTCLNELRLSEPSAAPRPPAAESFVEDELVKLNASTDQWWALYDDVGLIPDVDPEANIARDEACERAALRAVGATRENLNTALALPAVSVRELGLQARLVSAELREWWDTGADLPEGETACRILLDRMMGLAGVTRSPRYEPSLEEARAWFAEYLEAHREAEAAAAGLPPDTSRH